MTEYWRIVAAGNIDMPSRIYYGWHLAESARMKVIRKIERKADRDVLKLNTAVYCYDTRTQACQASIHHEVGEAGRCL